MDINDVASSSSRYPFAIDEQRVSESLRKLANLIDAKEVCVQTVRLLGCATTDDYTSQVLRLTFVEKITEAVPQYKSSFPKDVAQASDGETVELS